jgi:hypothetical protein
MSQTIVICANCGHRYPGSLGYQECSRCAMPSDSTVAHPDVDPVRALEDRIDQLEGALRNVRTDLKAILARIADGATVGEITMCSAATRS